MTALQDEQAVLWVDADVHGIDDSMLGRMLASGGAGHALARVVVQAVLR